MTREEAARRNTMQNEKRLIDANAFLKDILTVGIGKTIIEYSESDIGYMIRNRPTIDAVEVVRCKDCLEFETGVVGWCNHWQTGSDGMGFCSCGARMEGEAER